MTFIVNMIIACDGKTETGGKCPARYLSAYGTSEHDAREQAIRRHWVYHQGRDYCLEHSIELFPEKA